VKVQLFADEPYQQSFTDYFSSIETIELVTDSPDLVLGLTFLDPDRKRAYLSKFESEVPIVSNTLTLSATTAQTLVRSGKVVGMPVLPYYFARQSSIEISLPASAATVPLVVTEFLSLAGKTAERIDDTVAGVFPRTLAMIVNEAAFAVQESVASPEDIDTAMKLGTNYPKGPLAWCDEIGAAAIVAILDALAREYSPERYRPAALLRRYAETGTKWIPV